MRLLWIVAVWFSDTIMGCYVPVGVAIIGCYGPVGDVIMGCCVRLMTLLWDAVFR